MTKDIVLNLFLNKALFLTVVLAAVFGCKKAAGNTEGPITIEKLKMTFPIGSLVASVSTDGLRVRSKPTTKSSVPYLYPYKTIFTVLEHTDKLEDIEKRRGTWLKVSHPYGTGFVFTGFIEKLAITEAEMAIQGHWQYPGEGPPSGFKICAKSIKTKVRFCTDKNGGVNTLGRSFQQDFSLYLMYYLVVPRDSYFVFSVTDYPDFLSVYDDYAACASKADKQSFDCLNRCTTEKCAACRADPSELKCPYRQTGIRKLLSVTAEPNTMLVNHVNPIDYYGEVRVDFPDLLKP